MDIVDQQIIQLLQFNGKATINEIANKLNLTTSPVFERINEYNNRYQIISLRSSERRI